ncbi:hypothetical protein TDB9533_00186 [Thalassocella blandensis]|nr:hypothetical protein TDB9533_00186 [Thalassocella blandensis]
MSPVFVQDLALLTPLGGDATSIYHSFRAGLSTFQRIEEGEPGFTFSAIPDDALNILPGRRLPGLSQPQIRMLKHSIIALSELVPRLPTCSMPLFLAGPEKTYPGCGVNSEFMQHLTHNTGVMLDYSASRYFAVGRAGGFPAIDAAYNYLSSGAGEYALVGGVESYFDFRTLGRLNEQGKLQTDENPDGVIPSEGAVFLLLSTQQKTQGSVTLTLTPPISSAQYSLVEAVGRVFDNAGDIAHVGAVYSAENGDPSFAKETTLACMRHQNRMIKDVPILRPAANFGDVGAAFVMTLIGLSCAAYNDSYGSDSFCNEEIKSDKPGQGGLSPSLILACSDCGLNGALLVTPVVELEYDRSSTRQIS